MPRSSTSTFRQARTSSRNNARHGPVRQRAHCPALGGAAARQQSGRVRRPGAPAGPRQAPARSAGAGRPALNDLLGAARCGQDHPGQAARPGFRRPFRDDFRGAVRRQGNPSGGGDGQATGRPVRPPDHPLCRRSAPLQQEPAGCLPALCRRRHADLYRRNNRESLVRAEQRLALPGPRLCAEKPG